MFSWKERLYAFLLKRILGQYLSIESQQKLYTRIQQASVIDGSYIFNDISFNTEYITSHVLHNVVNLVSATIRTISIDIRLVETDEEGRVHCTDSSSTGTATGSSTSNTTAWKAFKFSISTAATANSTIEQRQQQQQQHDESQSQQQTQSAAKSKSTITLVIHVRLEGCTMIIEPSKQGMDNNTYKMDESSLIVQETTTTTIDNNGNDTNSSTANSKINTSTAAKTYLSSFLDAILSNLQLSMELHDTRIHVRCSSCNDLTRIDLPQQERQEEEVYAKFIETHIQSISYRDNIGNKGNPPTTTGTLQQPSTLTTKTDETILNKALDITRISVVTGTSTIRYSDSNNSNKKIIVPSHQQNEDSTTMIVALLDGTCRICLRTIANIKHESPCSTSNNFDKNGHSLLPLEERNIQQDISVSLHQKLNVSIDVLSLRLIRSVINSFVVHPHKQQDDDDDLKNQPSPQSQSTLFAIEWVQRQQQEVQESVNFDNNGDEDDVADFRTLESIMAQYREARLLVEKKEVRGGILLPFLDDNGDVSFDAFFDANEYTANTGGSSHLRHSSILKESIFSSIMCSSINEVDEKQPETDSVYRTFKLHIHEGGIKLSFPSTKHDEFERHQYALGTDYIVVTFNDIDFTSHISSKLRSYSFNVNSIEIENAMLVEGDQDDVVDLVPAIEVGTVLRFVPDGDCDDEDDDDDMVVQAPCLSLTMSIESNVESNADAMNLDIIMQQIEISYRNDMVAKLEGFFHSDTPSNPPVISKPKTRRTSINMSCASITCLLPLPHVEDNVTRLLYDRAGYISESTMIRESVLGFTCDRFTCELHRTDGNTDNSIIDGEFSCHSIIAFVSSPLSPYSAFDHRIHRLDFLCVHGRTEVDPCIPISIQFHQLSKDSVSGETNGCKVLLEKLFPRVPNLSSFKARQEDDENDLNELDMNCSAPQSTMISALDATDVVVSLTVPEIAMDLSANEIIGIRKAVSSMNAQSLAKEYVKDSTTIESKQIQQVAISMKCESVRLLLHVDGADSPIDNFLPKCYAFCFSLEQLHCFLLVVGNTAKQLRLLIHNFDFIDVLYKNQQKVHNKSICSSGEKISLLRQRGYFSSESIVNPILYRSYLFTPISLSSPSIHFDILYNTNKNHDCCTTNIYINLFHISYRHSYDSSWIDRLPSALLEMSSVEKTDQTPSIKRIFVSATDCNLDYTSPQRFHTASRSIIRIGEMRMSSNVVTPSPTKQAFQFSVSDSEILLCNNRFPYNFENSMLIDTDMIRREDVSLHDLPLSDNFGPDSVLRLMNFKSMLTAESISLTVVFSNGQLDPSEPVTLVTISTRQIYFFACRDSLARFANTIGEAASEMTAITESSFEDLKRKSTNTSKSLVSNNTLKSVISQTNNTNSRKSDVPREFLLDGYDWTAIDCDEIGKPGIPPGEEQSTRWYSDTDTVTNYSSNSDDGIGSVTLYSDSYSDVDGNNPKRKGPPLILHHFQLQPVVDPIGDGDMGAGIYAGDNIVPEVKSRIIVRDLAFRLRFFDGYDWPEQLSPIARNAPRSAFFVIPEVKKRAQQSSEVDTSPYQNIISENPKLDKKSKLLEDLLIDERKLGGTFENIPLPQEHSSMLKEQDELRQLSRRTNKFFQVEASGVFVRVDSMKACDDHRLVSCLNLTVHDLFLVETISSPKPVKMLGEWFNEEEHPRDSKEGLIFMKMVTWHPVQRVTEEEKVANDESDVGLKIHPLRCILDQRAIAFIRAFFNSGNDYGDIEQTIDQALPQHMHMVPPPIFTMFHVQPMKLKVDYVPQKLDTNALRNGAVVELINLIPLDGMVLWLQAVQVKNVVGFGAAMSIVVGAWVDYIVSTQLHKFVTKSRPFEPISEVGGAAKDLVVLPWEAFQNGESVKKALKASAKTFSKVAVYEVFKTASRVANFVSTQVSNVSTGITSSGSESRNVIPERPDAVPKTLLDTAPHAWDSLSRGIQEANYKIVIVPYREYHRSGAYGAAYSVVKGIPVAIGAPTSGAAEALSYALLGARNQIRPDIRKEDEATLRGLNQNDQF